MSDDAATELGQLTTPTKDLQLLSALLLEAEPTFVLDLQGCVVEVNAAAQKVYGWEHQDLVGIRFNKLVPARWHEQIEDLMSRCLAGELIRNVESARQDRTGRVSPVSLTLVRVEDDAGQPSALAVHCRDISELKLMEARLQRMTKVFMDAADPIIIRDLQGRIIEVNDEVERTFGWTRDELIGKLSLVVLPPEWKPLFHDLVERCLRGEAVRNYEFEVPNKAGVVIPVLTTLSLLTGESGEPLGMAQIIKDITELQQTAHELERSNRELEHFAAVVAHDLQQPLSTAKGYCDLVDRHHGSELTGQAQGFVQSISRAVSQAQKLVRDLLNYACVDRETGTSGPVSCRDAVDHALSNLR
jgi:PAS domain S-box-containing protein